MSSEDFRYKLFSSRLFNNESALQFKERLKHTLHSWISMAKIDTSCEGLFNLLLETQYLHACPKDLRIFLKQQGSSGQHDMVIMSDNFLSSKPREFNRPSDVQSTGMRYNSNSNQHSFQQAPVCSRPPQTSSEYNATPRNDVGARQSQPPTCFLCAKVGHIAKDCRVYTVPPRRCKQAQHTARSHRQCSH